jgi:hypothetical protein
VATQSLSLDEIPIFVFCVFLSSLNNFKLSKPTFLLTQPLELHKWNSASVILCASPPSCSLPMLTYETRVGSLFPPLWLHGITDKFAYSFVFVFPLQLFLTLTLEEKFILHTSCILGTCCFFF